MFRNICLIGLPHAGKSTIGAQLYKHLKMGFIDTDDLIRQKYNCELPELIEQVGNKGFLDIETEVIQSLNHQNVVLATGGSVIYREQSINHIKNVLNAEVYHLFLSKKEFMNRLFNVTERGVIINKGQDLNNLYNERMKLYNKFSDKTVSVCKDIHLDIFKKEHKMSSNDYFYERDTCIKSKYYPDYYLISRPIPPL